MKIDKIYFILMLENIIIIPLNAEFLLIEKMKNEKSRCFYIKYIVSNTIGGLLSYMVGFFFSNLALKTLAMMSLVIMNKENGLENLLFSADPSTLLMFKSLLPGIPISVLNIACGIQKVDLKNFILITLLFRTIRFIALRLVEQILRVSMIKDILVTLIIVSAAYTINAIMFKLIV